MSGHNKWSKIKNKKGKEDAKRGKVFTKIIKELTVAARMGGGDPSGNPRLSAALANAKTNNMPKETIERAIKRGTGELDGTSYEEFVYEGYGPGGIALLVEVLTDNKNRTVAEVRHLFSKYNGNLGESGCVAFLFEKKGVISFPKDQVSEDTLMEALLEAGAEDYVDNDDEWEVQTEPAEFAKVVKAMEEQGLTPSSAEVMALPSSTMKLEGKQAETALKLIYALEDSDDVQDVYSNLDIDDKLLEQFEG